MILKPLVTVYSVLLLAISCQTDTATKKSKDLAVTEIKPTEVIKNPFQTELNDFYFGINNRFNPIKKSGLDKAITFHNYISGEDSKRIERLHSVEFKQLNRFSVVENSVSHDKEQLSNEQLQFLRDLNYADDFKVKVYHQLKNNRTGGFETYDFDNYYTLVPEQQAVLTNGNKAFYNELKTLTHNDFKTINKDKFIMNKFYFTISKTGTIISVKKDRSCGYHKLDKTIENAIKNTSNKWQPAKNSNGDVVEQQLVLSFGLSMGC